MNEEEVNFLYKSIEISFRLIMDHENKLWLISLNPCSSWARNKDVSHVTQPSLASPVSRPSK